MRLQFHKYNVNLARINEKILSRLSATFVGCIYFINCSLEKCEYSFISMNLTIWHPTLVPGIFCMCLLLKINSYFEVIHA